MVPEEGVEPSPPFGDWILNPARLPVPPLRQKGISLTKLSSIIQAMKTALNIAFDIFFVN